jgi:hypothetical protein
MGEEGFESSSALRIAQNIPDLYSFHIYTAPLPERGLWTDYYTHGNILFDRNYRQIEVAIVIL